MDDEWDIFDQDQANKSHEQHTSSVTYSRGGGGRRFRDSNNIRSQNGRYDNDRQSGFSGNNSWRRDDEGNSRGGQNDPETVIYVNTLNVGKIIGKGGTKIRELQTESGARIKVHKDENSSGQTKVSIYGSDEASRIAQEKINEIMEPTQASKKWEAYQEENDSQPIDWTKVHEKSAAAQKEKWSKCPPMLKNFYDEHPSVAAMDPTYVEELRTKLNKITVSNAFKEAHIPNPIETFDQAFRHYPEILDEITKQGFKTPSPIQSQGWPVLLSGRDLIGIAQTGTGKTLAFLLPALIHIDRQPVPREERGGANMLVIAPTRELALQIQEEVNKYSYRGIKSVCVYGGAKRRSQIQTVSEGVEIIIATPGRLNDLVAEGVIEISAVTYLVLDEADRMLDMGFEPQIRKVLLDIRPDRQCVMTSATWPTGVRVLAEKYMDNPVQVFVGSLDLAAVHSVTQTILIVNEEEKRDYLRDFIHNMAAEDKVIVFVGRKTTASDLTAELSLAGVNCQSIHGDRDQSDREEAIRDLKSGLSNILIATDVASRGIDIVDITTVYNMDFPRNIEEYVHRVGRTGRAGRTGEAISLFTRSDWGFAGELIDILEEANQLVPEELYNMKTRFSEWKERRAQEGGRDGFRGRGRGGRGGGGGYGGGGGGYGGGGGGGGYGGGRNRW